VAYKGLLTRKRWRYAKRFDCDTNEIVALYRLRGVDVEYFAEGKWFTASPKSWFNVQEDPDYEWLTHQETTNLHNYLRSGFTERPKRLDLEPPEQYKKWKCPNCGTYTVVPIVIGLPSNEDMEASMQGHIILQGCIVYGDEPSRPIACTTCDWFGEQVRGKKIQRTNPSRAFQGDLGDENVFG
jgi:hypothetical protein